MNLKQKIILSTHLTVLHTGLDRAVVHRWTGTTLKAAPDLLEFLDFFRIPRTLPDVRKNFSIDQMETKVSRLMDLNFIVNADMDEEMLWLRQNFELNARRLFQSNHFSILYSTENIQFIRPLSVLLENAYRMLVNRGFGQLRQPSIVYLCRTEQEFHKLWGNNYLPKGLRFFVTKGRILAIGPNREQSLLLSNKTFYKAMVHEMVHIFLCQKYTCLPVWMVEGLCEYFRKPEYSLTLHELLRSKRLLSFNEIERKAAHSLLDIDAAPADRNIAYRQAHDFVTFLAEKFGEKNLLACIFDSCLSKEFKQLFHRYFFESLAQMQKLWRIRLYRV